MIKNILVFTLFVGVFSSSKSMALACYNACKESAISSYFEKLSKVFRKGSDSGSVKDLFSLFHDEVKYEHFEYDANFNKLEWFDAFQNNLDRGVYSKGDQEGMRVEKYIFGKSHVAVECGYGEQTSTGEWARKGDQNLLAVFGFKGKKIVLVREYW